MQNKTDATLEILSIIPKDEIARIEDYLAILGFEQQGNWQILVKFNGDIEAVARKEGGIAQLINNQVAVLTVPPEHVKNLLNYTEVEYMETPKRLVYNVAGNMLASCITSVQNNAPYRLTGRGVLLGIIDSGINYAHPDFRNADGSTRIAFIWDQSIPGNPPKGYYTGTEYTREQINEALKAPTKMEQQMIVPTGDRVGHGTHVAGIAGGNGRGSNGNIVGAAPESDFIIVKLGQPDFEGFVRNIEIMLAIRYVIEKAISLGEPIAINISIGTNYGPHDSNALLEQYIDDAATLWKNNIVIGAGNEANTRNHTSGTVTQGGTAKIEFQIGANTTYYPISIWQNPIDELAFQVIDPSGKSTPVIVYAQGPVQYGLGATKIYAAFAGPSPLSGDVEFAVILTPAGERITSGIWQIVIYGERVVDGRFDAWGPTLEEGGNNNFFLKPVVETTITTPATARLGIAVGAYNHVTGQIAPFSGRGFGRDNSVVKPDLVAPGVEISAASHTTSGYRVLSGTSMATPHVTGGIALMMEWGIVQGNNPFLYGENLKTYLLRGTKRDTDVSYPSPIWGYGKLCIEQSLDILRRQLIF